MTKRAARTVVLSKEAFLRHDSLRKELCELPEMGGSVWIRELSGKALLDYRARVGEMQAEAGENADVTPSQSLELMALLISLTVCNEDGNLMFTESEASQLAYGSISVLQRLSEKAMEVSGISKQVADEVADNLKNAQNSSSTAN
jgi:hypothetical protein